MKKNLIFEELSISNEVMKIGNELKEKIIERINQEEGHYFYNANRINILIKEANIILGTPIFDVIENVFVQVIFFNNKEDYFKSLSMHNFGGTTDLNNKTILLTIFGFDKIVDIPFLTSTLNHELKHCLQESLYLNKDIPKLYKKALFILDREDFFGNIMGNLARLIYFFDKNEINANMESLYQELIGLGDMSLKTIPILNEFEKYKLIYEDLKDYLLDDLFPSKVQDFFGKSLKELLNYISHRIEFFEIRKRKVLMKYKYHMKELDRRKRMFEQFIK